MALKQDKTQATLPCAVKFAFPAVVVFFSYLVDDSCLVFKVVSKLKQALKNPGKQ